MMRAVKTRRPSPRVQKSPVCPGALKASSTDVQVTWLVCDDCQGLVAVKKGGSEAEIDMRGLDDEIFCFICRHCRWEEAQKDILERLVRVEQLNAEMKVECIKTNSRIDNIADTYRRMEEKIGDLVIELHRCHARADKQDEKIETIDWKMSLEQQDTLTSWPKLNSISVIPEKKIVDMKSNVGRKDRQQNTLAKYIEKAKEVRKKIELSNITAEIGLKGILSQTSVTNENEIVKEPNVIQKDQIGLNTKSRIISFSKKFEDKVEGTVLLIGDSLARGVGSHLRTQHVMFESQAFGGARIEDITKKVEVMEDKARSHIVVMVGTNNLKSDGTELIMSNYRDLVRQLKAGGFRKITMVGILGRNDLSNYNDSKRMAMNIQLKELCVQNSIEFLEIGIVKEKMLDRKGLHLNFSGQDTVARCIFKHCLKNLN